MRTREANVACASATLESEISQRNARKDAQENTARGVIVTAGLVLPCLGLANDAAVFSHSTSLVARVAVVATVVLGAVAAAFAIGALWPRQYDRLGKAGLNRFNDPEFLDRPTDQVAGSIVRLARHFEHRASSARPVGCSGSAGQPRHNIRRADTARSIAISGRGQAACPDRAANSVLLPWHVGRAQVGAADRAGIDRGEHRLSSGTAAPGPDPALSVHWAAPGL